MRKKNIAKEDMGFGNYLGSGLIGKYEHGRRDISGTFPNTRFLYSLSPLEITVNGEQIFVPERATVKVLSGTDLSVNAERGAEIYAVDLLRVEEEVLKDLSGTHAGFFDKLDGKDKEEWDKVKDQSPHYVDPAEPNTQYILAKSGVVIAPAHSRFKNMVGSGWNLMYMRGSRSLGIGTDVSFRLRAKEAMHMHKITTEGFICLGGKLEVGAHPDERIVLGKDDVLVSSPLEVHAMTGIPEVPYKGITFQFPSIPGDKYTPEGIRTR